jgi:hypothetical protein
LPAGIENFQGQHGRQENGQKNNEQSYGRPLEDVGESFGADFGSQRGGNTFKSI